MGLLLVIAIVRSPGQNLPGNSDSRIIAELGCVNCHSIPGAKSAVRELAPDLSAAGAKLAAEGRCGNCHLPNFAGQSEMPRLAAQQENALVKALEDYKSGARRGRGNAAMPEITFGLSADDMKALAHFLSRQ